MLKTTILGQEKEGLIDLEHAVLILTFNEQFPCCAGWHKALEIQGLLLYVEALILYLGPSGAESIFCIGGLLLF